MVSFFTGPGREVRRPSASLTARSCASGRDPSRRRSLRREHHGERDYGIQAASRSAKGSPRSALSAARVAMSLAEHRSPQGQIGQPATSRGRTDAVLIGLSSASSTAAESSATSSSRSPRDPRPPRAARNVVGIALVEARPVRACSSGVGDPLAASGSIGEAPTLASADASKAATAPRRPRRRRPLPLATAARRAARSTSGSTLPRAAAPLAGNGDSTSRNDRRIRQQHRHRRRRQSDRRFALGAVDRRRRLGPTRRRDFGRPTEDYVQRHRPFNLRQRSNAGAQAATRPAAPGGKPSVGITVYQLPGTNALDVADRIRDRIVGPRSSCEVDAGSATTPRLYPPSRSRKSSAALRDAGPPRRRWSSPVALEAWRRWSSR